MNRETDGTAPAPRASSTRLDFPVVGIGASAGGLKPLIAFFEQTKPASGMAYVIILHLSPKHESNLDKLLQSATGIPVVQVNETTQIRKDHIYVIPPDKHLSMIDGMLHVSPLARTGGGHQAIDLFFRSLGEAHKSRAVCIVLSGTGSDGTVGMKTIKEQGGIAMAQDPHEAEYDSMPRNAIGTGLVDFVLPVADMPRKIVQLVKTKIDETTSIDNDLPNFIASTGIVVVFVDRSVRLMRFTPPAREIFNVAPGDIGRPLLDVTHRLEYTDLETDAREVIETLRTVEREIRSNTGGWYIMRILPYRTIDDHILGAVLTFVDITARKAIEEQLRRSEQRVRAIVDSVRDYAILTLDSKGIVNGWNPGAERIFGHTEAEILGQSADILFVPEDREAGVPQREMRTAILQGRAADERWQLRKDGSRFYCSGTMSPLSDGSLYGFVKIARDQTVQQEAATEREKQFTESEAERSELENASRLKDQFLATLSHELRNPLNLILMQAELLRRSPEATAHAALARATDIIYQTVRMQARLVDDLLDVSRISTGKLAVNQQLLPLPFVVGDSIGALQREMEQKQIELDVALTSEPLIVKGDPVRVKQIAWNLLSNAIKFTPPGGRVAVRVQRDGSEGRIEIEDNGQGIAPEFMPYVFELFRQSEPGFTRRYGGMGIGLALVRQLVDLQGGRVEAYSAGEGKGARFTVWLPLSAAAGERSEATSSGPTLVAEKARAEAPATGSRAVKQAGRLEALRILVIDDDAASAGALRDLLREEGATVRQAASGAITLTLAAKHRFDVVVSDLAMPDMDGYALLRALRQVPGYVDVPVIACTGFGSTVGVDQPTRAGFAAYFVKPLEIDRLVTAIRTAVSRHAATPNAPPA